MPLPHAPQRSRGTAAVVLTRPDPPPPTRPAAPSPAVSARWPRWFSIASGVLLGAAVLAIWALLLLGDSLRR